MDTVDVNTRSRIMASVGRKDTGPEIALRRGLHLLGFRYRLHDKTLPGSPDLIFKRYNAVIFVHGCFWHSHGCRYSTIPSSRRAFWKAKFKANRARDRRVITNLRKSGWRVMIVWECVFRTGDKDAPAMVAKKVAAWLKKSSLHYKELG